MNNNNSINFSNKLKLNGLEKRLSPFFNALPQDVPTAWMIPFLCFLEDFQFLQYVLNKKTFPGVKEWVLNIYKIFNPAIDNTYFYVIINLFYPIFIFYIYFVLFYHIQTNGRKNMSKRSLYVYNTLYVIVFKYLLSFTFNFFTSNLYICKYSYIVPGIPECATQENSIYNLVTVGCIALIIIFNYLYSNYNFNPNCLSPGKCFGSFHKTNCNTLMLVKLILSFMENVIPSYFDYKSIKVPHLYTIFVFIISVLFLYLTYVQLKTQPYYSSVINNYRFAVYFTISMFSFYTVILLMLNITESSVITTLSPFVLILFFGFAYKLNDIYYRLTLKRIYKKFREKQLVTSLKESISPEEQEYHQGELKKRSIYKSVERITNETYVHKEIKVFKSYNECEFACRFLRMNRNIDAYKLMIKIFEEGMLQFKHEANVYIMAWYYMHSMKKFYQENDLLKNYDRELFNGDMYLNNAMDIKLNMRKKFLITKAEIYIEIEKKKNTMNMNTSDVEMSIKLEKFRTEAVNTHVQGLVEIKELFLKLRNSTNQKDIPSYISNLRKICKYQIKGTNEFRNIFRQFPNDKDSMKIYVMFLTDVMNKDEKALKYTSIINQLESNMEINEEEAQKHYNRRRSSSISMGSFPLTDELSSVSGMGRDLRKKVASKLLMDRNFVSPIHKLKFKMTVLTVISILIFLIQSLVVIVNINSATENAEILKDNINIPGVMKDAQFNIRQLSFNLILGDDNNYKKRVSDINGELNYLYDINMESVSNFMNVEVTKSLVIPVGEYAYDSYEIKSIAESYKKFITNMRFCVNREMLSENETVYDILYEPHFKYFVVNSKDSFDEVFGNCKTILNDKILSIFSTTEIIVLGIEAIMILITFVMTYITFVPLKKSTNNVIFSSFRMFSYFSRGNFETFISDYEEKIETLCENYEIDKEIVESHSKHEKTKSYSYLKIIISILFIIIYIVISGIPVINVINDVKDMLSIVQQSADRISLIRGIQYYTYEVINQDRSVFLKEEAERILDNHIYKIEKIQEDLKSGGYGGPTFDSYPFLDKVTKENGCYRLDLIPGSNMCEDVIYNSNYGFSEEVGSLPLDELIRTYVYYAKNFVNDVEEGKYIKLPFNTKENIEILYRQFLNNDFFKLQANLVENILGDIYYINHELMEEVLVQLGNKSKEVVVLIGFGIALFLLIDVFIFNKVYAEKIKEMDTLVSFVFLVPQFIVNSNEQYKRFLETSQIYE